MTPKSTGTNEGIQANTVVAEVQAVGKGAKAEKIVYGSPQREALDRAVADLTAALAALKLPAPAAAEVRGDVEALQEATRTETPDKDRVGGLLTSLAGKLKLVGIVLSETIGLGEPLKKIAELMQIPLGKLGI